MEKKTSKFLRGEILSSICYIVLGLCLVLIPDQTVNIICKVVFGLVMIAAGIYHIVIYAAEKEKATVLDLFNGVIAAVLGVFLFFTPQIVIKILPYLLGAFVVVDSIWKFKGSSKLKKVNQGQWKVLFIGSLIFLVLGVGVMAYPFKKVSRMILVSGILLIVNGAADFVFLILMKVCLKKGQKRMLEKEQQNNVSDEATDHTEDSENVAETSMPEAQEENKADVEISEEPAVETAAPIELETAETADAAEAEAVFSMEEAPDKAEESPNKEIQSMLKNHDEPLEEWKD